MSTSPCNKKRKVDDASDDEPTTKDLLTELQSVKAEVKELKQKLFEALVQIAKDDGKDKKTEAAAASATAAPAAASASKEDSDIGEDSEEEEEDASNPWTARYLELREYRIINGNCNVSRKGPNAKLGKWVDNQRTLYKKGKLTDPKRIAKLEAIGFSWGKDSPAPWSFEEGFEELEKYARAMKNCNVTINPKSPSNLGKWVSNQRKEYRRFKKGKDSLLSLEQIGQLKDIGFNFGGPRLP